MQLINVEKESNITKIYYRLTFRIGWQQLVSIIDTIIMRDFGINNGKIYDLLVGDIAGSEGTNKIKELKEANYKISECDFINQEKGWISISGYSSIMEVNMRYTLWNQLNNCLIEIENEIYMDKEGERVYDKYVDSIEIEGFVNYTRKQVEKKLLNKEKKQTCDTNVDNKKIENNTIDVECFACHTNFQVNCSNMQSNQKTFYYKCPNCGAELKIGNPNYTEKSENEKQEDVTDRDKLINTMELPNNIRKLSEEERNEIICETIIKVSKVLKEIQCDSSEYELSDRQKTTKNNAINNIKAKQFLEAYYEITDFVDDYGNRHNGKIFKTEKQEINNLISIIYNNIKQ